MYRYYNYSQTPCITLLHFNISYRDLNAISLLCGYHWFEVERGARHWTPPKELCRALVSLVFLHTFFSLAQFCKKPCNPVFNFLQFFNSVKNVLLFFIASVLGTCSGHWGIETHDLPAGNVTLTIGIIPGIEKWSLFFTFIADTMSKRAKIKKPCSRTPQFSAELHCQAWNQRRTELVRGYLAPRWGLGLKGSPKTGWRQGDFMDIFMGSCFSNFFVCFSKIMFWANLLCMCRNRMHQTLALVFFLPSLTISRC